jgi:AraC-like DNA-binding protein
MRLDGFCFVRKLTWRVLPTVGYESANQFSREYRRFFGAYPKKDVRQLMSKPAQNPVGRSYRGGELKLLARDK